MADNQDNKPKNILLTKLLQYFNVKTSVRPIPYSHQPLRKFCTGCVPNLTGSNNMSQFVRNTGRFKMGDTVYFFLSELAKPKLQKWCNNSF